MKKRFNNILMVILLFIFSSNTSNVYGSGFAIFTQGASALGQADAVVAHTDSPSAIFFNPALINKLDGTQIEVGTTLIFPSREFQSDSGNTFKEKSDIFFPSTLFITHNFNKKISAGLGIFNPFGLATDWGDDWEGRYVATNSEMQTFNINPVVSYQVLPAISIAAGLNILFLDTTLEKNINLSPLPDGKQKFDGDGTGIGFNLGALFDITNEISIGASYRSEIDVDIDGQATFNLPDGTPPEVSSLFPNTNGKSKIKLPQQAHAGIYYKGLQPLTFEIGLRWEGWSSFKELKIEFDQPVVGRNKSITPKDWKDTYTFIAGTQYYLNNSINILAGYQYGGNPVPDETFEPSIPDSNAHLFSLGTSMRYKQLKLDLAYSFQKLQERNKNNSIEGNPNGKYKSYIHMVGISLTYRF